MNDHEASPEAPARGPDGRPYETKRPDAWLGYVPWKPDPAPLYVVLDLTPNAKEPRSAKCRSAKVRYASFDRQRAQEVKKDWALAGHKIELQEVFGGLDEVQGDY